MPEFGVVEANRGHVKTAKSANAGSVVCFLAVVLAAVSSPVPSVAPVPTAIPISAPVARQLDESLKPLVGTDAGKASALAVAIVQNGAIAYVRSYGTAKDHTRFPIASLTKMMTAVSVLQLVEHGRIKLEDHVSTYLPSAPYADQITVRQLLNHTSGLYNYGDDSFKAGANKTPTTPERILAIVAAKPLLAPPGTRFSYSNSGYVVLGQIIEHVFGRSLAAYEQQAILSVAGMTETTFGDPVGVVPVATGFMSGTQGADAYAYDRSWFYADGDIVSTARDIARFDLALMTGKLVSAKSFALAQTDPVDAPAFGGKWGLGFMIIDSLGERVVGHHGGVPGFVADDEIIQGDGFAMVVLANAFDFATSRASLNVIRTLYPGLSPPEVVVPEDPAVTGRFRTILESLLAGHIDRKQFADAANAALTDTALATAASQLGALGAIASIAYVNEQRTAGLTIYHYRVVFAKATLVFSFGVMPDGKTAVFRGS